MKPNRDDSATYRKQSEDALFRAILSLDDVHEIRNFLKDLCTPAELQALVDRWRVVELLQQDLPYRRIHELTGVSVTTIGRVARFLTDGYGGYTAALEHITDGHPAPEDSTSH
ncbi:MAG: YerC/YecD family TrpR-related protein [Gammaproteobacteria bacterium]|nr:YerC/YecD family TrpR-related protein [Gammaproteobacteria bacterium]